MENLKIHRVYITEWFGNSLLVNVVLSVKYKDIEFDSVIIKMSTSDCDIFGMTGGLSDNHSEKAKWLLTEVEKQSWFFKSLLKNYLKKEYERIIEQQKREKLLKEYSE